jgi:hypothetical protein
VAPRSSSHNHASTIARLELRLAPLELEQKAVALAMGAGLGVGAAIFLLFAVGFAAATAASALTLVVASWLALLIVTGVLLGSPYARPARAATAEAGSTAGARASDQRGEADHGRG